MLNINLPADGASHLGGIEGGLYNAAKARL